MNGGNYLAVFLPPVIRALLIVNSSSRGLNPHLNCYIQTVILSVAVLCTAESNFCECKSAKRDLNYYIRLNKIFCISKLEVDLYSVCDQIAFVLTLKICD